MRQTYINTNKEDFLHRSWVWSCSHLNADLGQGQNNIEIATTQLANENLEFHSSFSCGDFDSNQTPPELVGNAVEGVQLVDTIDSISDIGLTPSHLYRIAGNHDAGSGDMDWFKRYIDPLGENTAYSKVDKNNRPFGVNLMELNSWHSYYYTFNKFLVICISDRNDLSYPYGRKDSPESGGHPSGAMTLKTWNWVKSIILNNSDKNIIVFSHQNPRGTTIGTGDGDGSIGIATNSNLHGESGIALGSGSLYSIYDEDTQTADSGTDTITDFFLDNPSHTVVLWGAGHSHGYYQEVLNGKGEHALLNGVNFLNVAHLTRYHIGGGRIPTHSMSKVFEFTKDSLKVRHFNHEIINSKPIGFQLENEMNFNLKV